MKLIYKSPKWSNFAGRFHRVNIDLDKSCHTDLYDLVGNAMVWERTIAMAFGNLRRIITNDIEIHRRR